MTKKRYFGIPQLICKGESVCRFGESVIHCIALFIYCYQLHIIFITHVRLFLLVEFIAYSSLYMMCVATCEKQNSLLLQGLKVRNFHLCIIFFCVY